MRSRSRSPNRQRDRGRGGSEETDRVNSNRERSYESRRLRRDRSREKYSEDPESRKTQDKVKEPEKPNYGLSGNLAKETNTVNGVVLKYNEPGDAIIPDKTAQYRLFIFDGDDNIDQIKLNQKSWYLFGRDKSVCHYILNHPTCSKQHCVIQFRLITTRDKYGDVNRIIIPYLIDLESVNGSKLNGDPVPPSRYVELKDKDVINFGTCKTDYVFMKE